MDDSAALENHDNGKVSDDSSLSSLGPTPDSSNKPREFMSNKAAEFSGESYRSTRVGMTATISQPGTQPADVLEDNSNVMHIPSPGSPNQLLSRTPHSKAIEPTQVSEGLAFAGAKDDPLTATAEPASMSKGVFDGNDGFIIASQSAKCLREDGLSDKLIESFTQPLPTSVESSISPTMF